MLCKLLNIMAFHSVVLYSRKCGMLKLLYPMDNFLGIGRMGMKYVGMN